jgi:hypothetical protein
VDRLLKEDEARRQRQAAAAYPMSWDNPIFDTPFERRRLRILNSLFFAVGRMNGRPSVRGREAREIGISFFQQHLNLSLDRPKRGRRTHVPNTVGETRDERLCLCILRGFGSEEVVATWQDDDAQKLETRMTEIAVQVILTVEVRYREGALHQYEWRVRRKAELEEEERRRKIEAERAKKERQKRMEEARVNRLLRDATAFQQAGAIRQYVEALRSALVGDTTTGTQEFETWSRWALAQADRIDPAIAGRFLISMQDEEKPQSKAKADTR